MANPFRSFLEKIGFSSAQHDTSVDQSAPESAKNTCSEDDCLCSSGHCACESEGTECKEGEGSCCCSSEKIEEPKQ